MALIKCPECHSEISDKAESCPKCGYSFAAEAKKKKQSQNAFGCLVTIVCVVVLWVLLVLLFDEDEKPSPLPEEPKKELTEKDKYAKRISRCIAYGGLRFALTEQLKSELLAPDSYKARNIKCNYPKDNEPFKDTLVCIHEFTSMNAFGVPLSSSALLEIILPPYNEDMYAEKCSMTIKSLGSN